MGTSTSTSQPVYTYTTLPGGPGAYSVHVGATHVATVLKQGRGAWVAYTSSGTGRHAGTTRGAAVGTAVAAAMASTKPAAPTAAPTAVHNPQQPAPRPAPPQGRSNARAALLAAVWVLVALLTAVATVAGLATRWYALVGKLATSAASYLRNWLAAQQPTP